MTVIHYATPAVAAAATDINMVSVQTEDNHQRSLAIVAANADNFGGAGSEAFQQAIALVNHAYAQDQEMLQRASVVLGQANDSMTQHDATCAAQY